MYIKSITCINYNLKDHVDLCSRLHILYLNVLAYSMTQTMVVHKNYGGSWQMKYAKLINSNNTSFLKKIKLY